MSAMRAVAKQNCKVTFIQQRERIVHFAQRFAEQNCKASEIVIVVLNVDDPHGGPLADALMPDNHSVWEAIRQSGHIPYAIGLAARPFIQESLDVLDEDAEVASGVGSGLGERRGAAKKLAYLKGFAVIAVVIVDNHTAEVFSVALPETP